MVMEYHALIRLLEHLIAHQWTDRPVTIRMDCKHVVDQLNDIMRVKSPDLKPLYTKARVLMGAFENLVLEWIPREKNGEAHRGAGKKTPDI